MKNINSSFLLFFFCLLIVSCTRNDAQREFEQEAYQPPGNYTETSSQGEVVSVDENDWRIAPLFQGLVEINPPFPNPATTSSSIVFEVEITGVQSVFGLQVIWFNDLDFERGYKILHFYPESLQPGLTTFQINPLELGEIDVAESVRGIHRIFIFDGNQQMISYGDIKVE